MANSLLGGTFERIYGVARRIPKGRVATYGQLAALAGLPGQARLVGYAMAAVTDASKVPWHRVVNAGGRISLRANEPAAALQRVLLEQEGVVFGRGGIIPFDIFRWNSRSGA